MTYLTKFYIGALLFVPITTFAMESEALTNAVELDRIEDIEWAPCGTKVLLADASNYVRVYGVEQDQLRYLKKIETTRPATKIVSSPTENLIAVGLYNGLIETFDGTTFEPLPTNINLPGRNVQAITWLGKYVAAYTKDYAPRQKGKNLHYSDTTFMYLYDPTTGEVVKKFTIGQHVVDCKGSPSGKYVTLVKDLLNRTEDLFSTETMDKALKYAFEIYEVENFTRIVQVELYHQIVSHAWSPDSLTIALLLSDGSIKTYSLTSGAITNRWSSKEYKHTKCTIDWSSVTGYLAVPTKKNSVVLHSTDGGEEPVETIKLSKFTGDESKYLRSFCVKSSPKSRLLAISGRDFMESLCDTKLFLESVEEKSKRKRSKKSSK